MKPAGRVLVVAVMLLAGAGVIGLAASRTGLVGRLDAAWASWSLDARVEGYWDRRVEGDVDSLRGYLHPASRQKLGNAIQYLDYAVEQIAIAGDSATVDVRVEYRLNVPGFTRDGERSRIEQVRQRWVREGRTWYWEPAVSDDVDEIEEDTGDVAEAPATGAQAPDPEMAK